MGNAIEFQGVWKQFRRGEIHDSLRDLIPTFFRRASREQQRRNGDRFQALRDVTFNVPHRKSWGIIRPNGAGKSTVLKPLLQSIARTCQRAIVLDRGRIAASEPPGEVINTYLRVVRLARPGQDRERAGAELRGIELTTLTGQPVDHVQPGERLRLRARGRFLVQADNITFGLALTRTSDNVYAYGVHTTELGIPPISVAPGDEHELSFEFSAHLTRGLYSVSLHARDMSDQTFLDYAHGCALIDMGEQISYGGVADLAMSVQTRRIPAAEPAAIEVAGDSGVELELSTT